ncbi:MAG: serine protein kinase RIO [Candidatus Heimdallarchaeota archaeon]
MCPPINPRRKKEKGTQRKNLINDEDEKLEFDFELDLESFTDSENKKLDRKVVQKIEHWLQRDKRSEDRSVINSVLDTRTLVVLEYLLRKGFIDPTIILSIISTGKEANIYYTLTTWKKEVAVKIYRMVASDFKRREQYLVGDPRFRTIRKTTHDLVYTWAQKEFKNLQRAYAVGVRVPKPEIVRKNVLVIEFIGKNRVPARLIRDVKLRNPKKTFQRILEHVRTLYKEANLVHADLSEYNILIWEDEPILIDFAQAVLIAHPLSSMFLQRDLENISNYFSRLGVATTAAEVLFTALLESNDDDGQ